MPKALEFAGLECPHCSYDLTGLTINRCPECGGAFDPAQLRPRQPTLQFEAASGIGLLRGFLITWFWAVLMPWRFARRSLDGLTLRRAAVFAAICFAVPVIRLIPDVRFLVPWFGAALAYMVAQSIALTALDVTHWKKIRESFKYWLSVAGYSSAIVITEIWTGPVIIFFYNLLESVRERKLVEALPSSTSDVSSHIVPSIQLGISLIAPVWCLHARLRRRTGGAIGAAALALFALAGLLVIYSLILQEVGMRLYDFMFPHWFTLPTPNGYPTSNAAP